MQAAFQIQLNPLPVLSFPPGGGGLGWGGQVWSSGRIPSSDQSYIDYAGPTLEPGAEYTWRVRIWAPDGSVSPWSAPAPFAIGLGDQDWQASWIARVPDDDQDRRDHYTLARRELTVPARPLRRARVYVASYHQHELRIDGRPVCRGPAFAYPDEGWYQAADVTGHLRPGATAVVAAVTHWYGPGQGRPEARPGLLVRLVLDHADGGRTVVVTDGSWRVARGPWRPAPYRNDDGRDYVEHVDARAEPPGWDRPGFDAGAAGWRAPEVLGVHPTTAFTHLRAQEVGLTHTTIAPAGVSATATGGVLADFGRVVAAVPVVRFEEGAAGRAVAVAAGYLTEGGQVSRAAGTQATDMSFRYVQRDGAQAFAPFTYLGFRYLQVDDAGEQLGPGSIAAVVQHTDVDLSRAATFRCADPTLTAVFELAMRSALVCSQWQFLDTPTREKGQFLADAANVSRALMGGYRDRALTSKAIGEFVASQRRYWPDGRLNAVYPNGDGRRDIPDFTELFCGWVWDYFLESGDRRTLAAAYPAMAAICAYLERHRDARTGLVTDLAGGAGPYAGGIVDWPPSMRYGFDMAVAARTTVNVLAVDALRKTVLAGAALGRPAGELERLRALGAGLARDIDRRLRLADGRSTGDGVVLNMIAATHFGNPAISIPSGKLFGPWLVYFNDGSIPDALAQAGREEAAWPYTWLANPQYPLARTTVHGRIRLADGRPAQHAIVTLAQPGGDLYTQGSDYQFSARADAFGAFTIGNVRPGTYSLYAFADAGRIGDVTDQLEVDGVGVAGPSVDVGTLTWSPPSKGRLLWRIGAADRTAAEFRLGGLRRQYGLFDQVPADLTYTIGQSTPASDWYYAQTHVGTWTIAFDLDRAPTGTAVLTMPVASASRNPTVQVEVNGAAVSTLSFGNDQTIYRSGTRSGFYQPEQLSFPASLLHAGPNTIAFAMTAVSAGGGIMYDTIQLAAG